MKLWILALVLCSTLSAQQSPPAPGAGAQASSGETRLFQDVVNAAPDGAVLFADDYRPVVKVGIVIPDWRDLTIVGGTFQPDPATWTALSGANWGRLKLIGCSFRADADGRPANVVVNSRVTFVTDCTVEGLLAGNDISVTRTFIDAGRAPRGDCDRRSGPRAGVYASRLFLSGSFVVGQAGGLIDCASCGDGLGAGAPGVFCSVLFLDGSAPSFALGGLGETSPHCPFPGPQAPAMVVLGPTLTL